MSELSHYFIAIPLHENESEWLLDQQVQLQKHQKLAYKNWTYKNDLHITLKFLGAVTETRLKQLKEKLLSINTVEPFQLTIGGIGTFGKVNKPRVLWSGVEQNIELKKLYNKVEDVCFDLGFPKENRNYHPHITLAKKWVGETLEQVDIQTIQSTYDRNKTIQVNHFVVYKIHPTRTPKYEVIEKIDLK